MKKETEIKYPNAANLFNFCRRVLDHKFGGIRVIDQDVGQILGFDPADCSHWKKGKKNIRSIHAMKSIAEHLGVDERLVVDIAAGDIDDVEGYHEYCGYGLFEINDQLIEKAKKEYHRRNASTWTREKEQEVKRFFEIDEARIDRIVERIHQTIGFDETPLYLPEIAIAFPDIALVVQSKPEEMVQFELMEDGNKIEIRFPSDGKMRPYIRHQIAKAMALYFFSKDGMVVPSELGDFADQVLDVQANLFASKLLTPVPLIRKELKNANLSKDIVSQLAETFWVSKVFMNRRLKEILEKDPHL
jgi:hypothetical protein